VDIVGEDNFGKAIAEGIERMQNQNLEVDVQYQMNDKYCSVLILGREK
jgi:hypothetical protein